MKGVLKGIGKRRLTSTSKIRKITPTRKNFIQNCKRVTPEGSKPLSNGLVFSLFGSVLYDIIHNIIKKEQIARHTKT